MFRSAFGARLWSAGHCFGFHSTWLLLVCSGLALPGAVIEESPPPVVGESPTPAVDSATLVALAHQRLPQAAAFAAARHAAAARIAQARTWANPELELSLGRTRPRTAELEVDVPYGVRLAQRLEWSGKRDARVAVAVAQARATDEDAALSARELELEVRRAIIALASAQQAEMNAAEQAKLADALAEVVAKRQELGDIDRGEAARIRLEATTARLHHEAAARAVALHRAVLRTWCGEVITDRLTITDALNDPLPDVHPRDEPAQLAHPQIRAALAAEQAAQAQVAAARQARIPEVTVGVFADREWDRDAYGVSLGLEIPLWDRNHAQIAEAQALAAQRRAERDSALLQLARARAIARSEVAAAAAEVIALRDHAVPAGSEALQLRMLAFTSGEASLGEVLEARRATLTVQSELLEARRRYAEAQVRLRDVSGVDGEPSPAARTAP